MRTIQIPSEKWQPIVLLILALCMSLVIGYIDESTYSFNFLFQDAGAFIFYTLLFSIIPLAPYHILLVTRAKRRAFLFAILCYVPLFLFILSVLVDRFTRG